MTLVDKRARASERRAIRKAIQAVRFRHVLQRDGMGSESTAAGRIAFEVHSRIIQGLDEALMAIKRHARKR